MELLTFSRLFTQLRAFGKPDSVNDSQEMKELKQLFANASANDYLSIFAALATTKMPANSLSKHCASLASILQMQADYNKIGVRIIPFVGKVDHAQRYNIEAYLEWIGLNVNPPEPTWFILDSTGGKVKEGKELWKLLQKAKQHCPIGMLVLDGGGASSTASLILAGGTQGLRFAHTKSRIVVHQPRLELDVIFPTPFWSLDSQLLLSFNKAHNLGFGFILVGVAKAFVDSTDQMAEQYKKSGFHYRSRIGHVFPDDDGDGLKSLPKDDSLCPSTAKDAQTNGIVDVVYDDFNKLDLKQIWSNFQYNSQRMEVGP